MFGKILSSFCIFVLLPCQLLKNEPSGRDVNVHTPSQASNLQYNYAGEADGGNIAALPAYFTPTDAIKARQSGWTVIAQTSRPPSSDSEDQTTYAYWPNTGVSTQSTDLMASSTWSGQLWAFVWANRVTAVGSHNFKPNPIFPMIVSEAHQCRLEYTTLTKANTATKVRIMHLLGYSSSEYIRVANAAGFSETDILSQATIATAPDKFCTGSSRFGPATFATITDRIVLNNTAAAGQGIMLDYEVQDGRTASETRAFIEDLASTIHAKGKKIILYTNAINGAMAPYNGLTGAALSSVYSSVDIMSLFMAQSADFRTSYVAQRILLGAPAPAKVCVILDMASSLANVQALRELMISDGVKCLIMWANGQVIGGSDPNYPSNQKIKAVVFGQ